MFRGILIHLFSTPSDTKYTKILLGLITIVGLILRLYLINSPIGYDEAYTFINFSSKPFKFILADYHAPNNHILNSLLIGIVYRIFGDYNWIVRLPSFIAGALGIPVSYIMARKFFSAQQSLAAAAVLAVTPNIVAASANGRGYTLIILFSLLLVNFAGLIIKGQSRSALIAYAITGALGFYSIPIFLYPMAGISLWVIGTYLVSDETRQARWSKVKTFLMACMGSGAITFLLYSPVIIFGTGFNSLVGNDIVKSQTWHEFFDNIVTRSYFTWQSWMSSFAPAIRYILGLGFILSAALYRKVSNQRLPLQVFLVLGAIVMLMLQRVFPLPRIWGYLEMFYLLFSAAGLIGMGHLIFQNIGGEKQGQTILSTAVLLFTLIIFINVTSTTQSRQARLDRTVAPEQFAAEFLAENLTRNDTIVAVAPADIQTAYYLKINGISYEYFYQRDHPVEFQNAMVLVRTRGEYNINTLDKVLDFYELTAGLDVASSEQVFEYGPLFIFSIPAK
jgi:uncharacterized membrane protein